MSSARGKSPLGIKPTCDLQNFIHSADGGGNNQRGDIFPCMAIPDGCRPVVHDHGIDIVPSHQQLTGIAHDVDAKLWRQAGSQLQKWQQCSTGSLGQNAKVSGRKSPNHEIYQLYDTADGSSKQLINYFQGWTWRLRVPAQWVRMFFEAKRLILFINSWNKLAVKLCSFCVPRLSEGTATGTQGTQGTQWTIKGTNVHNSLYEEVS